MAKPVLASGMRRPRPSATRTESAVEVPLNPEAEEAHHEGERLTELQALLDATPRRGGVGRDAALDDARGVLDAASRTHSTVSRKPRGVEHGVLDTHFTAVSRKFPSPWQQWFSYVKACSSQVCSFELIGERMNCPNASLYNSGSMLLTVTDNTQHTLLLFDTSVLFQALAREWLTWQSLMIGLVGSDAPCGRPLWRTRGQGFGVR